MMMNYNIPNDHTRKVSLKQSFGHVSKPHKFVAGKVQANVDAFCFKSREVSSIESKQAGLCYHMSMLSKLNIDFLTKEYLVSLLYKWYHPISFFTRSNLALTFFGKFRKISENFGKSSKNMFLRFSGGKQFPKCFYHIHI